MLSTLANVCESRHETRERREAEIDRLHDAIQLSINGIAAALRNTG